MRGDPVNGWQRVAEFRTSSPRSSHIGPAALVAAGGRYLAVGQRERAAVAWTSPDGTDWAEIALPAGDGTTATTVTSVAADPEGRLAHWNALFIRA